MNPDGETGISREASVKRPPWMFLGYVAIFFGLIFLRLSCEQNYYQKGGIRVQGVVTQKAYSQGTSSSSNARTGSFSSYYVMYRFTTKDGRTHDGKDDVLPGLWRSLKVGDRVAVEYLSESPDTNQIPGQRAGSNTFLIMGLSCLLAGLALAGFGLWKRQAIRLGGKSER
jgi:hypothetical protein